uniref:Protein tyrosine phosphatase 4A2b n=1 Tax=Scophthalmus maximus TaxID=52904 RepID=A0A8D3D2E1_SCOMX
MRFLITHNPTNATLNKFTEELKKFEVNTLVRVCDSTYDKAPVEKEGIQVLVRLEHRHVCGSLSYRVYPFKLNNHSSFCLL